MNNPLTRKHSSNVMAYVKKGNTNTKGKPHSKFGKKFKEHYGITKYQNRKLYYKEAVWYHTHNHMCRWEV